MNNHWIPLGIALLLVLAVVRNDDRLLLATGVGCIIAVIVLVLL